MTKTSRVIHLLLFLAVIFGLNYWLTGSAALMTGDTAIWLHAGLFMLVIGVYWIEPFFTRPADVVVNSLVVFVSVSTLNSPPYPEYWAILRYSVLLLMGLAFISIVFGSPDRTETTASRMIRIFYDLAVRLGGARVLFSAVFLLALISYFDLSDYRTKWFAIAWAAILLGKELRLSDLIDRVIFSTKQVGNTSVGRVTRFVEPNIIRFAVAENAVCKRGDVVAFTQKGAIDNSSPIAYVINHRRTANSLEAEAILVDNNFREGAIEDRLLAVVLEPDSPSVKVRLEQSKVWLNRTQKLGFAQSGSDIGRLEFETVRKSDLEEGHLVCVEARSIDVYYQITDACLREEASLESSKRLFTIAGAQQLGSWNDKEQGFFTFSWVPPENTPVFQVSGLQLPHVTNRAPDKTIGHVPNSDFPVQICLQDFVLYHSAILGVTGTGKSFLAYDLIERSAEDGIKVLCLDITGDYKRYLDNAVMLGRVGDVEPFLNVSDGRNIGIIEFTEQTHPITSTRMIVEKAKKWCQGSRSDEEFITPKAKVLLVLEEAHMLVPEWNFNPQRNLQDTVSQTAQAVLQARKYGLGFCVITQRTANVTKSILNQCNTIFSFQAFDETGFDFLRNYMGREYVSALPNLRSRHGVFVGKSSKSSKPLIVRFNEQDRVLRTDPADVWSTPEESESNRSVQANQASGGR